MIALLAALVACTPDKPADTSTPVDDTAPDSGETGETADSGDSGDTAPDSGDTAPDSGDSGDTAPDSGDSGDTAPDSGDSGDSGIPDADGDGADASVDCDDENPDVHPGATEVCNGWDDDCDGSTDGADATDATTWYADADADGYGDPTSGIAACEAPADRSPDGTDCDDTDPDVHPDAEERCDELDRDEDCDGVADDDDSGTTGLLLWTRDQDADGYGAGLTTEACEAPVGYAAADGDCDDLDPTRSPGRAEVCDTADVDEDCDGTADDADTSTDPASWSTWRRDSDGDGYGDDTRTASLCDAPAGYLATGGDCDDADRAVHPGATEVCDAADTDEDCDGLADTADADTTGLLTLYADADGDSYGDAADSARACDLLPSTTLDATDCNDHDGGVNPGATEVCDAADTDEDCDGFADDPTATGQTTWHLDGDGDGHGGSATTTACDAPAGATATATDCDDADPAIHPGAAEVCDARDIDEDCDGLADDADASVTGTSTWYDDADHDGYGDATTGVVRCDAAGGVGTGGDCDDAERTVHPGAAEVCDDGLDNDCDGSAGTCELTGLTSDATADTILSSSGYLGTALAWGDLDGDGLADLVVGAPSRAYDAYYDGYAFVYSDPLPAGRVDAATTATATRYQTDSMYRGIADELWVLPDITDDGNDELVVGIASADEQLVELGPVTGTWSIFARYDLLYSYTGPYAGAGHYNADTVGDFLVGDTTTGAGGTAYLYAGVAASSPFVYATFTGEASGDAAGSAVTGGGDVDGDGADDAWIGAQGQDAGGGGSGAVYLVYGSTSGTMSLASADARLAGQGAGDAAGEGLVMPGDVDGDGHDDVLIGAPGSDLGAANGGVVYLVTSAGSTLATASVTVLGEDADDGIGASRRISTGDVNGDGEIDLLVSTHVNSDNGSNAGKAWLLYGPLAGTIDLATDADAALVGETSVDWAGYASGIIGDVDGDGFDELAVGAPMYDKVYVWMGGGG